MPSPVRADANEQERLQYETQGMGHAAVAIEDEHNQGHNDSQRSDC